MTKRADYTSEEWRILSRAIPNVAFLALTADGSNIEDIAREEKAVYEDLDNRILANDSNELLMSIDLEGDEVVEPTDVAVSLDEIKQCATILSSKSSQEEEDGIKQFLYNLAHDIANAYAESEGKPVSDNEAAMLEQLKGALGV